MSNLTQANSKHGSGGALGVLFTGYMEKQNPIRKTYSKRFLVLTHEAFYWFKRPDHKDLLGEERGSISLSDILGVRRADEYSFDIEDTAHGHRTFRYIAGSGSVAQCDEWITQIRSAYKKLKDKEVSTARDKRIKTSLTTNDDPGTPGVAEPAQADVVVRMVTLKSNGVELVMARNPLWQRLIRIPVMKEGDVVLISTSDGGQVTLSRDFMFENASKSQEKLRDMIAAEGQRSQAALPQGTMPSIGVDLRSNAKAAGGWNSGFAPRRKESADEALMSPTASTSGLSTDDRGNSTHTSAQGCAAASTFGSVVEVPVLETELPSSLRLSVSWCNDEVDSALKTPVDSGESGSSGGKLWWLQTVSRQALKDNGDNITLILAIMCTIVGATSLGSVNPNNSLLFMFCMCLSISLLIHAVQKARTVVEGDRQALSGADLDANNSTKLQGSAQQSLHLVILGHSFTSPDQPIMQAIESIPQRFINACEGDVEAGRKRYEITRHWRETEGVNTILVEKQPHFHHIKNFYPHYNAGVGRQGHVVYYERPGELMPQLKQLLSRGIGTKEMLRHWLFVTEFQFEILCKGDPMAKGMSVIDVKGVGVFDFMGKTLEFVKKSVAVAGLHYPERSYVIYIVNANSIFTTIWSIIKGWIHENTAKKVRILGPSETLAGLQEHIDISQIPEYYGGQLCFGDDKDGCRYHSPQSEAIYELVRRVNSGEITKLEEVYAMFDLEPPVGGTGGGGIAATRKNSAGDDVSISADIPVRELAHSPQQAARGSGGANSLSEVQRLSGASTHVSTPVQRRLPDDRTDDISPITMTPASSAASPTLRQRKTTSSGNTATMNNINNQARNSAPAGTGRVSGKFQDSPDSRLSPPGRPVQRPAYGR